MTFIQNIYEEVRNKTNIGTDEFSTDWLGQSRSYYSSNKARGLEASIPALVCLMNKLTEQERALSMRTNHQFLLKAAKQYENIATQVGEEIAKRSMKTNLANQKVKEMLYRICERMNECHSPSAPAVIIGF